MEGFTFGHPLNIVFNFAIHQIFTFTGLYVYRYKTCHFLPVPSNAILDVGNYGYQHPFTTSEKSSIQSYVYLI